jgi:hypothetical protein
MVDDVAQQGTHGLRTGALIVGEDVAVELVRQALTGRGIAPGDEWQIVDLGNCWSVQNLPVVRFLVTKDTGQVLGSSEQVKTSGLFRRGT